jgi:hypothetical protein
MHGLLNESVAETTADFGSLRSAEWFGHPQTDYKCRFNEMPGSLRSANVQPTRARQNVIAG